MKTTTHRHDGNRQAGTVLLISLIFLLLLTLIGVGAMQTTSLEEKMAGNSRQRSVAFQAAEVALRDAEWLIEESASDSGNEGDFVSAFDAACSDGLCASDDRTLTFGNGYWRNANWDGSGSGSVRALGRNFSELSAAEQADPALRARLPASLPELDAPPDYIIEANYDLYSGLPDASYLYRVTARGYGGDTRDKAAPRSRATLQTLYRPQR